MKKAFFFLALLFHLFLEGNSNAAEKQFPSTPSETILFTPPNIDCAKWKEITRHINRSEAIVERIPSNQTRKNWSELIAFQYIDKTIADKKVTRSIDSILEKTRKTTLASYPPNHVTWKIIEKNKNDAIYEWTLLHTPHSSLPEQELCRIFLTKNGFHRLGITKKMGEMSEEEKIQWLNLLKGSTKVVSIEQATSCKNALSLLDQLENSLDLGSTFSQWEVIDKVSLENGCSISFLVSPLTKKENFVMECLELLTMATLNEESIDKIFEKEKQLAKKKTFEDLKFHVIKKSADEILYVYSYAKDQVMVTEIARGCLSDQGYFSVRYRRGLIKSMNVEEIKKWQEALEKVKLAGTSAPLPYSMKGLDD